MRSLILASGFVLTAVLSTCTLLAADERPDCENDFATVKLFFVDPLLLDAGTGYGGGVPGEVQFQVAEIFLNDKFVGNALYRHVDVTPTLNLAPGDYQVRIESEGYERVEKKLTVLQNGSTQWLVIQLRRAAEDDAPVTSRTRKP